MLEIISKEDLLYDKKDNKKIYSTLIVDDFCNKPNYVLKASFETSEQGIIILESGVIGKRAEVEITNKAGDDVTRYIYTFSPDEFYKFIKSYLECQINLLQNESDMCPEESLIIDFYNSIISKEEGKMSSKTTFYSLTE